MGLKCFDVGQVLRVRREGGERRGGELRGGGGGGFERLRATTVVEVEGSAVDATSWLTVLASLLITTLCGRGGSRFSAPPLRDSGEAGEIELEMCVTMCDGGGALGSVCWSVGLVFVCVWLQCLWCTSACVCVDLRCVANGFKMQ